MSIVFVDKKLEEEKQIKEASKQPEPKEIPEEKAEDKIVVSKKSNKKK